MSPIQENIFHPGWCELLILDALICVQLDRSPISRKRRFDQHAVLVEVIENTLASTPSSSSSCVRKSHEMSLPTEWTAFPKFRSHFADIVSVSSELLHLCDKICAAGKDMELSTVIQQSSQKIWYSSKNDNFFSTQPPHEQEASRERHFHSREGGDIVFPSIKINLLKRSRPSNSMDTESIAPISQTIINPLLAEDVCGLARNIFRSFQESRYMKTARSSETCSDHRK